MQFYINELNKNEQIKLLSKIVIIIEKAPLYRPTIPRWNKPFNQLITNAGKWGWSSDIKGYKYINSHPKTGRLWPEIPLLLKQIWRTYTGLKIEPNSCLINLYENLNSTLGLHQDKDENDFSFPVLSISFGNTGIFNYGRTKEKRHLKKIELTSGSLVIMQKKSRLMYHSISKILQVKDNIAYETCSKFFPKESRVNLTLRRYSPK